MLEEYNNNNRFHKELVMKILKDSAVSKYMSIAEIIELLEIKIARKYVLIINGESVGIGFIIPLRDGEVEIRYCIESAYRSKGYSKMLISELLKTVEIGNVVYADIQVGNIVSRKSIVSNGFITEDDFVYKMKR